MWRPIATFKREIREKFPTKTPVFPDLYLLPSDTLKTAIVMCDEDRVHRLVTCWGVGFRFDWSTRLTHERVWVRFVVCCQFIVRSALNKTPIGVLTQTDLLRFVMDIAAGPLFKGQKTNSSLPAHSLSRSLVLCCLSEEEEESAPAPASAEPSKPIALTPHKLEPAAGQSTTATASTPSMSLSFFPPFPAFKSCREPRATQFVRLRGCAQALVWPPKWPVVLRWRPMSR
jgi:hypothetical protein